MRRAKGGIDNVHPLGVAKKSERCVSSGRENVEISDMFLLQSGAVRPLLRDLLKMIAARTGEAAGPPFLIHPHMLRHSTGYNQLNDGHDTRSLQHYMGHKNIMHTVRYTEMAPDRFKNFWRD